MTSLVISLVLYIIIGVTTFAVVTSETKEWRLGAFFGPLWIFLAALSIAIWIWENGILPVIWWWEDTRR